MVLHRLDPENSRGKWLFSKMVKKNVDMKPNVPGKSALLDEDYLQQGGLNKKKMQLDLCGIFFILILNELNLFV